MAVTVQALLQIILAQKGMPTSVQSAVTMLQDTTMGSGRVKAVKHSLKGVFKVGESAFDNCLNKLFPMISGCRGRSSDE